MKKYILVVLIAFSLFPFLHADAAVTINEIMYDLKDVPDTDHEWVELYNDGDNQVSLTGWRFNDGSNHTLNKPPQNGGQGNLEINSKEYIILTGNAVTFLSDHPGFSGTVIDTVMSLNNTGSILSIIDNTGATVDSISYTSSIGANGDGHSLGRVDASILNIDDITPGYENIKSATIDDNTDTNSTDDVTDTSGDTTTNTYSIFGGGLPLEKKSISTQTTISKPVPILVKMISTTKSFSGIPITFSSAVTGPYHEALYSGKFLWSFGDGATLISNNAKEFTHTYEYPGEYIVYLEYYQYEYNSKPDAIDRATFKILPTSLSIANINSNGSIEITNQSNQEIDLIGWKVKNLNSEYMFTNHIIILPKNKIQISKFIHRLNQDNTNIELIDPSGNKIGVSVDKVASSIQIKKEEVKIIKPSSRQTSKILPSTQANQTATVINASENNPQLFSRTTYTLISLGLLMMIVTGSIVFLWTKKQPKSLLEETVNEFDIEELV